MATIGEIVLASCTTLYLSVNVGSNNYYWLGGHSGTTWIHRWEWVGFDQWWEESGRTSWLLMEVWSLDNCSSQGLKGFYGGIAVTGKPVISLSEILKSSTRNQKNLCAFLMFFDVQLDLENLSTNMTLSTWFMWLSMWKRHLWQCIVKCVEGHKRENWEKRNTCQRYQIFQNILENPKLKLRNGFRITAIPP